MKYYAQFLPAAVTFSIIMKVVLNMPILIFLPGIKFNTEHAMRKFSRQQIDEIFSQKIRFDISCKLSPLGDNLHGMSNPTFYE